jgi:hypothetical protein
MPPAPFCFSYFSDRVLYFSRHPGPRPSLLYLSVSWNYSVYHHTQLFWWDGSLINFLPGYLYLLSSCDYKAGTVALSLSFFNLSFAWLLKVGNIYWWIFYW